MTDHATAVPGVFKTKNALINKDNSSLLAYKKAKVRERRIKSLEQRLDDLEQEIHSLKAKL